MALPKIAKDMRKTYSNRIEKLFEQPYVEKSKYGTKGGQLQRQSSTQQIICFFTFIDNYCFLRHYTFEG